MSATQIGDSFYDTVEQVCRDLYIEAQKDVPPDVRAALRTALERETFPRAKRSLETMLKAIELGDKRAVVYYNHIVALMREGDMARTRAALKTAIAEYPSDKDLFRLLDQCVEKAAR